MEDQRQSFRARWVIPVTADPIENATLEIENGRISALHTAHDPHAHDLGNVAILPGLINVHTHLEFSHLSNPLAPSNSFVEWIRSVVQHRGEAVGDASNSVRLGVDESIRSGTTLLGEIATSDEPVDTRGLRLVSFRELIGLQSERVDEQLQIARRHLDGQSTQLTAHDVIRGVSPHAPYSVHPRLFVQLVDLASERNAPLAIHLAETQAELELLSKGTGSFVPLLKEFGVWSDDIFGNGRTPLDDIRTMQKLTNALIVHGNYLSDEEIDFVVENPNLAIAYCPRTHAYFGHRPHPWRELLARGATVALGTDSRASNPDLSLWREVCFLQAQDPDVSPATFLRMATVNGATALGLEADMGSLESGKSADLTVVALPDDDRREPYQLLFDERSHLISTMCGGRWIRSQSQTA